MNTFVLLMIWSTSNREGGVSVVQQEFNSQETCKAAMIATAKAHNGYNRVLSAYGCFKK